MLARPGDVPRPHNVYPVVRRVGTPLPPGPSNDSVMGASTWVPLVTAAAGLIAGLAAGLVSTIMTRRWASEDRAEQWRREDTLRWQRDRQQVYARMVAVLDAWDAEVRSAVNRRLHAEDGSPPPFDAAGWNHHQQAALELVAQLRLMAPEQVTGHAKECYAVFGQLRHELLHAEDADLPGLIAAMGETARATRGLVEAMRADLGLGDEGQPAAGAEPRPPG